ncbi:hypothetical protein RFI_24653 [Reticulomyxa filosa]|uniref:Phospholipid/glycerol acyltransferase domain-containing protein n=1 Tax=Reticulomyxa filosa TaxID=46433 RepID=X6MH15_RETFI|nr:hypothetical protein RFI_24653 [Reticulomyxa filosa]|eukprot:ETO12722.1 hypothetical protein RFI_24653 [Reticulomyxa filosa]
MTFYKTFYKFFTFPKGIVVTLRLTHFKEMSQCKNVFLPFNLDNVILPSFEEIPTTFFPFIRHDDELLWTTCEKCKTVILALTLFPIRVVGAVLLFVIGWMCCELAVLKTGPKKYESEEQTASQNTEKMQIRMTSLWSKIWYQCFFVCLRLFLMCWGVYYVPIHRLTTDNSKIKAFYARRQKQITTEANSNCYPIVSNHLGYLDILYCQYFFQATFVAKAEFQQMPRKKLTNVCFFVIKKMWKSTGKQNNVSFAEQLQQHVQLTYESHQDTACNGCSLCQFPLVCFPEGTTTNGKCMLQFRRGIFNAGVPVQPVAIRFKYKHFNPSWESIYFTHHTFRCMTQLYNHVEMYILPTVFPTEEEKNDPCLYAWNVQQLIRQVLDLPIYMCNRDMKIKGYHAYMLRKLTLSEALQSAKKLFDEDSLTYANGFILFDAVYNQRQYLNQTVTFFAFVCVVYFSKKRKLKGVSAGKKSAIFSDHQFVSSIAIFCKLSEFSIALEYKKKKEGKE